MTKSFLKVEYPFNTHFTRAILFQPIREGGLGVPNIEWVYTATRTSHLINMLNNDDSTVREMARESLIQHMQRRKVPPALENEPQFLGFKTKGNGKLDIKAAGFGVRSDWMDLNDLCHRSGLQLTWATPDNTTVALNNRIITDPLVYARASYEQDGTHQELSIKSASARASILGMKRSHSAQHWTSLKLQGKLALLPFANQSLSHSVLSNNTIGEDILIFTIKARLQVLPTKSNLATWYPSEHDLHYPTPTST